MEKRSARESKQEMRRMVEERLALLRSIDRSKPPSMIQYEAVGNVIDDVRVLWRIIDWLGEEATAISEETAPAYLLLDLFVKGTKSGLSPEEIWKAFVRDQLTYLASEC